MSRNLSYDVVIVGAGPAGCFTAQNLSDWFRVLLIEKSKLPRSKSCGGVLVPEALELLRGYKLAQEVFSSPKFLTVEGLDWDYNLRVQGNYQYINADRDKFDEHLLNLAKERESVEIWPQTRFVSVRHNNQSSAKAVNLKKDNQTVEITTKYLVGADGATSRVRKTVTTHTPARYFTLQEQIKLENPPTIDRFIAITEKNIDFYAWVIPKGETVIIGTAFDSNSKNIKKKFGQLIRKVKQEIGIEGEALGSPKGCPLLNIKSSKDVCPGKNNVFLVGEAAGLVAPTIGEGISYALKSGFLCAQAINNKQPFEIYKSSLSPLRSKIASEIMRYKVLERPYARSLLYRLHPRIQIVGFSPARTGKIPQQNHRE